MDRMYEGKEYLDTKRRDLKEEKRILVTRPLSRDSN